MSSHKVQQIMLDQIEQLRKIIKYAAEDSPHWKIKETPGDNWVEVIGGLEDDEEIATVHQSHGEFMATFDPAVVDKMLDVIEINIRINYPIMDTETVNSFYQALLNKKLT